MLLVLYCLFGTLKSALRRDYLKKDLNNDVKKHLTFKSTHFHHLEKSIKTSQQGSSVAINIDHNQAIMPRFG